MQQCYNERTSPFDGKSGGFEKIELGNDGYVVMYGGVIISTTINVTGDNNTSIIGDSYISKDKIKKLSNQSLFNFVVPHTRFYNHNANICPFLSLH